MSDPEPEATEVVSDPGYLFVKVLLVRFDAAQRTHDIIVHGFSG